MHPDPDLRADDARVPAPHTRAATHSISPSPAASDSSFEDRLRALHAAITSQPPPRAIDVVALVDSLASDLRRQGRARDLDTAIDAIERRRPGIFEYGFCYFQSLRVENQLLLPDGNLAEAVLPLAPFCAMPELSLLDVVDALLYHGRRAELLSLFERGLLRVEDIVDVEMELEGHSLRELAVQLVVDRWLEEVPHLTGGEVGLLESVSRFEPTPEDEVRRLVDERRGWGRSALRPADFTIGRPLPGLVQRLDALLHHFATTLSLDRGWPRSRAQLARLALRTVLFEQLSETLGVGPFLHCDECVRLATPTRRPRRGAPRAFLPDLANLFDRWDGLIALPGSPYRPAALLEALPAWLDYLSAAGLVSLAEIAPLRRQLAARVPSCATAVVGEFYDPLIADNLSRLRAEVANKD